MVIQRKQTWTSPKYLNPLLKQASMHDEALKLIVLHPTLQRGSVDEPERQEGPMTQLRAHSSELEAKSRATH